MLGFASLGNDEVYPLCTATHRGDVLHFILILSRLASYSWDFRSRSMTLSQSLILDVDL